VASKHSAMWLAVLLWLLILAGCSVTDSPVSESKVELCAELEVLFDVVERVLSEQSVEAGSGKADDLFDLLARTDAAEAAFLERFYEVFPEERQAWLRWVEDADRQADGFSLAGMAEFPRAASVFAERCEVVVPDHLRTPIAM
jgi:hypothetical protein